MSERLRTGIKLAVASAVIALSGLGIGLAAQPADDLPEQGVAVGQADKRIITISDRSIRRADECRKGAREWSPASTVTPV